VSVSNVGHGNPAVVEAVCRQAHDHMHLMVYGEIVQSPQVLFAQKITSHLPAPLDTVYFVNSGSEAVEGALKLAKRHTGRTELVSFHNAYHGSTHGSLSLMGDETFRNAFRPLLPDVRQLGFNDFDDLSQITARTAAVLIEPVQGEGGIRLPVPGFLEALRARCTEVGAMLIFDEIQTGFGRTGRLFACQGSGVVPDILVMAKAMGGGMPLGGFAASHEVMAYLRNNPPLGHITTFGGHPVCCAAGLAAFEFLETSGLVEQVEAKSERIARQLSGHRLIREIRRAGLMMAVELGDPELTVRAMQRFIEQGVLPDFFLFCDTAFRIAPPLTVTDEQIDEICAIVNGCLDKIG
jgi:acetylornithine/succinyldiaminopimelate/putrescine aminotransferase